MRKLSKCFNPLGASFCKGFLSNNSIKQSRLKKIFFSGLFYFIGNSGFSQDIAGWNFFGRNLDPTLTAITFDPNLVSPIILTRGSDASASSSTNSFRTTGFQNDGISVTNKDYFQTTFAAKTGYEVSLSTIDATFAGTASFYAAPGVTSQFAYSLDGITFILIGNPMLITTPPSQLIMPQIDLRGINALQNVSSDITITIRYYASGQTTSGGWGFYSSAATKNGFVIGGSVTSAGSEELTSGYYRSRQNGNWATATTWESSPDNVNWSIAGKAPTKDAEKIMIQNGHTVGVSTSISLDQTIIAGTLELQTGGILNINDGIGDDITIAENGILRIASAGNYPAVVQQAVTANINIATGGKIEVGNGTASIGNGYEGFATSIMNIWNDKSIYEWNSNSTFATAGLTYFPNTASAIPIFRVTKVGGIVANGSGKDFIVNGIFELNTDVSFSGAGDRYFRIGIRGNATLSQTGAGKFYLTATGAFLDGSPLKLSLSSNLNLLSSSIIPIGANVIISGANIDNNLLGNTFTINGRLDVTDFGIKNTNGTIILNGFYRTTHIGGFSGASSSIPSGNITLTPGSTIELYADGNQSLNARSDFKNLIFSGSGIKTPSGPFSPNGTITIKDDAIFDCSGVINAINIGDDNTNLTMTDNSRLIVSGVITNPKMGGVYNLTGGVVEFRGSNLTSQNIRNQTYQNIEVTGTNVNNSDGNIILKNLGTFTVKSGAVFTINDNTIAGPVGTQKITVESGGTFKCGNTRGFHGFAFTSVPKFNSSLNADIENIILEPNSTVEYSRSNPPLTSGDQPITNANNLVYQNLILSGTGNKTAPAGDLIIQGNLSKSGSCNFIHNDGTVIFNGNNAQTYLSSFPQMVLNNFTNNNTVALNINNELSIYKKLLLGNNSKINLNADINLQSSKTNTANVSLIPTNAAINYTNGRFIVERYINTGTGIGYHPKSWQFLSTPAFGETVHNTWQEKGNKTISNFGTWITDPAGTDKGFDAVSFSPSMKYYNPSMNNWMGIAGTNVNLESEKGYMIFVRGDRLANEVNSPATSTTLRTKGKLYAPFTGFNPPIISVDPGKYQSIGNPYASVIDFTKLIKSPNVDNSFYVWDPTLGGEYGVGGYQTITAVTGFKAIPGGTSIYNTIDNYRNIQSGQAFFVHNSTGTSGSVTFTEASKTDAGNHLVNRDPIPELNEKQFLFASLYIGNDLIVDGNAIVFGSQFSNKIGKDDAVKINNSGENFGIKREDKIFVVETREMIQSTDTIFYDLVNFSKKKYTLKLIPENMQKGIEAFLTDRHLKTVSTVSLTDTTFFEFSITDDPSSFMSDRFFIAFKALAIPKIFSFVSVNAYEKNSNVFLEWNVQNENNLQHFVLEHSVDGIEFSEKAKIAANDNLKSAYGVTDKTPLNGINYYRILAIENDGRITYSEIIKVELKTLKSGISVYPNPLTDENINLHFIDQPEGKYSLRLLNSLGQSIFLREVNHAGGNDTQTLQLNKKAAQGVYQLEVISPDGTKNMISIKK